MRVLILARHGVSEANLGDLVSGVPPGEGLAPAGVRQAEQLGRLLAGQPIELGVATSFRRTQETLADALAGRDVPRLVLPAFDEIRFGSFEGGPLAAYREWAWTTAPGVECPGGGESRAAAAARFANALDELLARPEQTILAIGHALPIRYVLDAAEGRDPAPRVEPVGHAEPYLLDRDRVERAALTLRAWSASPAFRSGAA